MTNEELKKRLDKAAMEVSWPISTERMAIAVGVERGVLLAIELLTEEAAKRELNNEGEFGWDAVAYLQSLRGLTL